LPYPYENACIAIWSHKLLRVLISYHQSGWIAYILRHYCLTHFVRWTLAYTKQSSLMFFTFTPRKTQNIDGMFLRNIDIKITDKLIDGNVLSGSISLLMLYLLVILLVIFILMDIATMNYCSRFLKNGPHNMCCQIHWWILPKEFRRILMPAIFLCHWQFLRHNTDDIFCRGGSKQFIALCNSLLKRLIIYKQKFYQY
jgi:hypothetical protein